MDTLSNVRRSVLAGAPIAAALLILTTAATAHAAGPSPVAGPASAPVTHPDDDHLGSTIRAHEPSTSSPQAVTPNTAVPAAAGQPLGMDVSNYQGTVGWASAVANGAQFVYIKATEGTGFLDGQFGNNYTGSYDAGLIRGAYHFALPDRSSGAVQANYFVDHGGGWSADGRTLPPMLDIEYNPYGPTCYGMSGPQMSSWIRDFSNTVEARTGRYPTTYSTANWWNTCTGSNATFGGTNPLFIACYCNSPGSMPAGWEFHTIWQYNDHGIFPGDQDIFNGSIDQLRTFAGVSQTTIPCTAVVGAIGVKYAALGGCNSFLGRPISTELPAQGGRYTRFEGGDIYWSPATDAHVIKGAIEVTWRSLGAETGQLGFPTTDEFTTPDTVGRYNHFQGGSIYFTPQTGAHEIYGVIDATWASLGYELGPFGYPTTGEFEFFGRVNLFQRGFIYWNPATGAIPIHW